MAKKSSSPAAVPLSKRLFASREDVHTAVVIALVVVGVFFAYRAAGVWSSLQGPKIDSKLTKAQQEAILNKWIPFSFSVWNDGQLGASLFALAFVSYSAATTWVRDKNKALAAAAAFFFAYPILSGFSIWLPISVAVGGVCAYGSLIFSSKQVGRNDVVNSIHTVTARILFVVDAALISYAELLRLQSPDFAVTEDDASFPAAVDPALHRAARAALVVAFLLVAIGNDVHAYRGMLRSGFWISFAALCPCLGVYEGGISKKIVVLISLGLVVAHVGVHAVFPFNVPIVQFFRRWRSDMKRVVAGAGDE